jgi:Protein of unknown function (DUF3224)
MSTSTSTAAGTFAIKSWDEGPWAEDDSGRKLTHASVTAGYRGDIEGEGSSRSVMYYRDEAHATYAGFERVVGRLGGRSGSFVLQAAGTYEDGAAATSWTVVPGSGTGELAGLRGTGGYVARHGASDVEYRLDYSFE